VEVGVEEKSSPITVEKNPGVEAPP